MNKVINSRKELAKNGQKFITDGCTILIHSFSRAVHQTLIEALNAKKNFTVYVTESAPNKNGVEMYECLRKDNINVTLILDAAVGYIMERVDLVLVGAEGVAESGGIINKVYFLKFTLINHFIYKFRSRLEHTNWRSVPKRTTSHFTSWWKVTNSYAYIRYHNQRYQIDSNGGQILFVKIPIH